VRFRFKKAVVTSLLVAGSSLLFACQSAIKVAGFLEGEDYLVAAPITAKVDKILVNEGQLVRKGQELASLDSEEVNLSLKNAEAAFSVIGSELDRARSVLNRLPRGNPLYSRLKQVYDAGGISKTQLNRAGNPSGDTSLRSQAELLVRELESQKAKAEVKVEELKALSRETTLVSPADGLVTKRYIQVGQRVGKGDPAYLITNANTIYLTTTVPERELGKIKIGQMARVRVDNGPNQAYEGELSQIESKPEFERDSLATLVDPESQIRRIKIQIQNSEGLLKPGMKAHAKIESSK